MIAIRVNENNEVVSVRYQAKSLMPGEVEVVDIPLEPELGQYEVAVMILEEGKISYRIDKVPEPEPEPEIKPNPSEQRRQAYRAEVDELSTTYVGYKADAVKARKDGNEALAEQYEGIAENILEQIGEKKAEIRERYPDEVEE